MRVLLLTILALVAGTAGDAAADKASHGSLAPPSLELGASFPVVLGHHPRGELCGEAGLAMEFGARFGAHQWWSLCAVPTSAEVFWGAGASFGVLVSSRGHRAVAVGPMVEALFQAGHIHQLLFGAILHRTEEHGPSISPFLAFGPEWGAEGLGFSAVIGFSVAAEIRLAR